MDTNVGHVHSQVQSDYRYTTVEAARSYQASFN